MPNVFEKRGPIEKQVGGWPINPFGVVALAIFTLITIFLIIKPLVSQKAPMISQQKLLAGGQITTPQVGEIIRGDNMTIELLPDEPQDVQKVQFWAKTYVDNNWQVIGEVTSAPFKLDWQIPDSYKNKAIAMTSHIYQKDGKVIKDPGGWREGIIILGN